jgi:hypothetical protein
MPKIGIAQTQITGGGGEGGSTSPGGSSGELQFNSSGSFGALPGSSVNAANQTLFLQSAAGANTPLTVNIPTAAVGRIVEFQAAGTTSVYVDGNGDLVALVQFDMAGYFSINSGLPGSVLKYRVNPTGLLTQYCGIPTVSNGAPAEYATVDLTGQTAAISATTLYTPTLAAMYRISAYAKVTTAGTTGSLGGSTGLTLTYADGSDSVAQSVVMALANSAGAIVNFGGNTTTSVLTGSAVIFAAAGTPIQYAFDYSSSGTPMQYELHMKLEQL